MPKETGNRQFADRVIIITGAAAGVGRAIAMRFAAEGAKLGLISRDSQALDKLALEVREAGGKAAVAAIDVSEVRAVFEAANQFARELGPIDMWINDAMLTVFSPVADITADEFRRVTDVTYLGVVHGCMAALKHMRVRPSGHIINIGSALAYRGIPLQSAYCGAKHAIRGFTASLRAELKRDNSGIAVSILELPAMNTPQFDWARTHMPRQPKPMGTIYQPEVAAAAVLRAARTRAPEYWVGTSTLMTIVGNMISPALLDWYLARKAVEGQEAEQSVRPDRRDNLLAPVTDLHRTRGVFDAQARTHSTTYAGGVTRACIIAAGALLFFAFGMLVAA